MSTVAGRHQETDSPAIRSGRFSLRTVPARWFELLTARDDLTMAVETLARTDAVELETHSEATTRLTMPDLHNQLEEYNRLAQHYQIYWPEEELHPSETPGHPSTTLERALVRLRAWRHEADPLVDRLEALHSEEASLLLLREMLNALGESRLHLSLLSQAGPALATRLFVLPLHTHIAQLPPGLITLQVHGKDHEFLLAVGPEEEANTLEQELGALKGRRVRLHGALRESVGGSLQAVGERLAAIREESETLRGRIVALQARHRLHEVLGDIARLEWFLSHVTALPVTENFAWVTGWTSNLTGEILNAALEKAGVRGLLRFPEPPRDKTPPMVMHNPWWAQPFELFARLLGTPDRDEADPSRLLVAIVPLLFGYMFGDVGQGAVLLTAGLLLQRRWRTLRLLVPAGLSSIVFGFLFGSLFSREDLLPALWVHPIEAPITILVAPLVGGALLLLLGLVLNGLEAHWRGQARRWWLQEAGLLPLYVGVVLAFFHSAALWAALAGLLWFLGGSALFARGGDLRDLGRDLGYLAEHAMQLAVNTLSFARVGAFALAHAGLSTAVVALADVGANTAVAALVMVVGNALIIMLEGLVVSIQITRLVLFEFFIRFLRGEGRGFRPLAAPPGPKTSKRKE